MTVTATSSRVEYAGNGVTVAFTVPFYFLENADLKVYKDGTLQTITTHYTVSGAGTPAGGTVTFLSAPAASQSVVIFRDPAMAQDADYVENDPFPAQSHERALDKLTMIAQRIRELVNRSFRLSDSDTSGAGTVVPTPTASKLLGWNSTGTALENYDPLSVQDGNLAMLLAANGGSSLIGFLQSGTGAVISTAQAELRKTVDVKQFGAVGDGITDDTESFQRAVDYFASVSNGYSSPYVTIKIPGGTYNIAGANGVVIPYSFNVMQLCFESDSGARITGNGTNYCFKFNSNSDPSGGGFKNIFKKIIFADFATAILWHTNNRDQCMLKIIDCESQSNDVFLDTVGYTNSRSSLVKIESCFFTETRVAITHYTDHMTIQDCWFYAKEGSYDALLYLGGDGVVDIRDTFFIPNATPLATPANARFIDVYCSGTANDRSIKTVTVSNCRHSLESARCFMWFYDYNTGISGNNKVSSITIENSYFGGTGGNPVVTYRQGYPGSVSLKNCKVFASPEIVSIGAGNTYPPVPSSAGSLTYHVIMIDEATRLSQSNSNNNSSIIDPDLEPFCYDTTSQTSKYKRSYKKNIDYRLESSAAGAGRVKVSLPVYFDSNPTVGSRDIMSFIAVTVSDAGGPGFSSNYYRTQTVTLVSVVGGNDGSAKKRIVSTALQDSTGGISFLYSSGVSVFWGTGNTGSADIAYNSTTGDEDNITIAWNSTTPEISWCYIIPLAGLRENQQDKMQYDVW